MPRYVAYENTGQGSAHIATFDAPSTVDAARMARRFAGLNFDAWDECGVAYELRGPACSGLPFDPRHEGAACACKAIYARI
jgi:hypothetical protein